MDPRRTGANNSAKHFNPKLACHGLYELHKDNKAVVYPGSEAMSLRHVEKQ